MQTHIAITLLLGVVAAVFGAPRAPFEFQVPEEQAAEEAPRKIYVDSWPVFDFVAEDDIDREAPAFPDGTDDVPLFQGNLDLSFDLYEDSLPILTNGTISDIVITDLERRIIDDMQRIEEEFLLLKKLMGHTTIRQPALSPWAPFPVGGNDGTLATEDAEEEEEVGLFGGFPWFGINRPVFPDMPEVPNVGFADPADLPDNYSNETHTVHNINGTQVVVNNTINKQSGDDFNSFFHHQVIHFKPEEEPKVTDEEAPLDEVSQEDDDEAPPVVENEVDSIPEVNPEISISNGAPEAEATKSEEFVIGEEDFRSSNQLSQHQSIQRLSARSLHEFNPIVFPADDANAISRLPGAKSAAYVSNSLTEDDAEDVWEEGEEPTRGHDLSDDTRVNRVHADMQGMTLVDPDAEIFNYSLVLKEANQGNDEK